jgi:hypothetical protein
MTMVLWVSVKGGNRRMSKKIQPPMVIDRQCASQRVYRRKCRPLEPSLSEQVSLPRLGREPMANDF